MGFLNLEIDSPGNEAPVVNPVRLRGRIVDAPPGPLYVKWYSSLHQPSDVAQAAIKSGPFGPSVLDFDLALPLGEQLITFAAKDMPGDDEPSLRAVVNGGFAGGEPTSTNPKGRRIHVVQAGALFPPFGTALSRAGATLVAAAPPGWSSQDRKLRVLFRFTPLGAPAGRRSADLPSDPDDVVFRQSDPSFGGQATLTYSGPLGGLDGGDYTLHTRLEATEPPHAGDEQTTQVFLTA